MTSNASAAEWGGVDAKLEKRPQLQLTLGPGGMASTWRGDGGLYGGMRVGARFFDVVSIDVLARLGYATVDERTLTYLALGASVYPRVFFGGRVRPFARVAVVHQHEETIAAIHRDAFGALLGVGDGIRHRGGFSMGLGADVPFARAGSTQFFAGLEAMATVFPDARGPEWYFGGGAWLGVSYAL
jgi:hypothetical protein